MAAPSNFLSVIIALHISITLLYPLRCNAQSLFVFGDSLYDPGNNIYITKDIPPAYYPPYGTTFFNHSTGRFSDGRVVPDFIAVNLHLPFPPAALDPEGEFLNGANFASAGAGVFDTNPDAMYFGAQVEKYGELAKNLTEELGAQEANAILASAVHLISISGDDYFAYLTTPSNANATVPEMREFVDSVLTAYVTQLKNIYDIGGRKFMIHNLAPIGCLPMMKKTFNVSPGDGCAGKALTLAKIHNDALPNAVQELQNGLPGFMYSIFDYYTSIGNRINNPTAYGFKEGDVACCGTGSYRADSCGSTTEDFELCFDPNEYVWFDGGHNTDNANSQMANLIWSGQDDVVAPFNMKQLFELGSVMKVSSRNSRWFLEK